MTDHPLIAFLRARLEDDERIARDADGISRDTLLDLYEDLIKSRPLDDQRRAYSIHISHFTSGRMLWDITAKRHVLDWLERTKDWAVENNLWAFDEVELLKLLALPYASHPDYREEWRL